ncbi:MAG: ATP-binding protein, partial [Anaerobiospirillum sp.]|nr:ATP-binding protein [Anaerobiospirillum sp.]
IGHILEPFYRVHGDRSEIQGTGLGLAIVKASCDSIKADLKFANVAPHGLSVTVDLPNLDPKTKDVAAQTAGTKAAKATGAKVTVEPKGAAQSPKA